MLFLPHSFRYSFQLLELGVFCLNCFKVSWVMERRGDRENDIIKGRIIAYNIFDHLLTIDTERMIKTSII